MDEPYEWIDPDDGNTHVALGATPGGRELLRVVAENALLRRERALLIELEKARTRILASIFNTGGGCSAEDVRQVGELLMAVEAIHLEASGGVQRPEGVGCACVLCRPEGAAATPLKITSRMPITDVCTVCGKEFGAPHEVFEGRCHDCISAGRRGKES